MTFDGADRGRGGPARLAAIDIGSTALRLRVADVDPPALGPSGVRFGAFREVASERAAVRLGSDVFTRGAITARGLAGACSALRRFQRTMIEVGVERYRAVATSAVREATNGAVFVARADRSAGVRVETIGGDEEARLIEVAVRERVALGDRSALLIDIGGGSTELTLLAEGRATFACSLPIGTVRLLQSAGDDADGRLSEPARRLLDDLIALSAAAAFTAIRALVGSRLGLLLGTGGNVETLAERCPFLGTAATARAIDVAKTRALVSELGALPLGERVLRYGLRPDRADTIVPAAMILCRVADAFGLPAIGVPGVGLKEGVLLDLAHAHFGGGGGGAPGHPV